MRKIAGVWVQGLLSFGNGALAVDVVGGMLLEIGVPTAAGFPELNGSYLVKRTDNLFYTHHLR